MRTQNKVQKNSKRRENQKVFRNDQCEVIVKNCPKKKQTNIQQPKFKKTT